jgi:uncharacterized protein (TIRG00374 family)
LGTLLKKWLSIIIPLLIGIGIIYYQYTALTVEELENIKISFQKADYNFIILSLIIALIGYWIRAFRWKYALHQLGYSPRFSNNLLTVCVSYLVNLTVPRSGEISRAALLKKYENVPFDKGFGTIVAERIIDLMIFLLFVILGFILQFDKLNGFLVRNNVSYHTLLYFGIVGILIFLIGIVIWIYAEWNIVVKLKSKLSGLVEGMTTLFRMKNKWEYIICSFLIWISYLAMFYVSIFALPETQDIGFDVVVTGFIFGSLAIGFSNGGLGAYPFSIALIFSLYGISNDVGTAFGWLVWTSQTLLTIFLGLISYLLLPLINRKA